MHLLLVVACGISQATTFFMLVSLNEKNGFYFFCGIRCALYVSVQMPYMVVQMLLKPYIWGLWH